MHMTMEQHIIRIIFVKFWLVPVFVIFLSFPVLPFPAKYKRLFLSTLLIPTCLVGIILFRSAPVNPSL